MVVAVWSWQCIASTVTTVPARSTTPARWVNSVRTVGISLVFSSTAACPITTPRRWSNAATRCGVTAPARRAPRTVLPSRAITRRPATTVVVVHIQTPITASNADGSNRANTRRNTEASGLRRR